MNYYIHKLMKYADIEESSNKIKPSSFIVYHNSFSVLTTGCVE